MGNLLAPFKKFLSNKNTITILGVLLGIVVLYFGYTWRVKNSVQPTQIPYATRTLISGTKITESDVSFKDVPKSTIKNMTNLVTNKAQIVGMLVSYDSKIPANGFFFSENLITEEAMPDSVFSLIPDGDTIFMLSVNATSTYGNAIFPDDAIDLYMITTDDDGLPVYGRLISSIRVLQVRDKKGKNAFADKDNPSESAMLLFAVPEEMFLLLKKAQLVDVKIEPVPRSSSYSSNSAATKVQSEELESMILNRTHTITNECTNISQC